MAIDHDATHKRGRRHGSVAMPFAAALQVETIRAAVGDVRGRIGYDEQLTTVGGAVNGGVIRAIPDARGGRCAFLSLPDGAAGTTTIASATNFLRAVRSGSIEATANPLHAGRTDVTDVADADDRFVARLTEDPGGAPPVREMQ